MRVAFICGSLAPGRDGVGDYCRRLGSEMRKLGHDILLISLNDRWCQGEGKDAEESMPLLRCASATPLKQRVEVVGQALQRFRPDWVSLQFVCFGYHPKGLPWRWNAVFADLGRLASHRHLMLHELWIGPPPLRRWLLGLGQKWLIRDLGRRFRPDLVTTSMNSYQYRLSRIGITARVLPLFGNIPLAPRNDDYIAALLRAAGSRRVQAPRTAFLNGVFFGTVHPDFDALALIAWLSELRNRAGKPILLSLVGRTGAASKRLAEQVVSSAPDAIEAIPLGEQSEEIISQALQYADFGINTCSPELLGKSGTHAAMREHGLPVVLADGALDAVFLQTDAPPVRQFSTNGSVMAMMNHVRPQLPGAGVTHTAAEVIRLFETRNLGNHVAA
jgi:hypothetical protein